MKLFPLTRYQGIKPIKIPSYSGLATFSVKTTSLNNFCAVWSFFNLGSSRFFKCQMSKEFYCIDYRFSEQLQSHCVYSSQKWTSLRIKSRNVSYSVRIACNKKIRIETRTRSYKAQFTLRWTSDWLLQVM